MINILMDAPARMGLCEESHLTVPISMPHSERAIKMFNVVENYPQRTGPHQPRWGHESLHSIGERLGRALSSQVTARLATV